MSCGPPPRPLAPGNKFLKRLVDLAVTLVSDWVPDAKSGTCESGWYFNQRKVPWTSSPTNWTLPTIHWNMTVYLYIMLELLGKKDKVRLCMNMNEYPFIFMAAWLRTALKENPDLPDSAPSAPCARLPFGRRYDSPSRNEEMWLGRPKREEARRSSS